MNWIKEGVQGISESLYRVYQKSLYFFLSLFITLLIIILDIGVINYKFYFNSPGFKPMIAVFFGSFQTLPSHSVILLFVSAVLSGILVSFLTFHIKNIKRTNKAFASGTFGGLIGLIAPACSSCGIGLAAILGLTGFVGALPYEGTEIAVLGIILLVFSLINLSAKITIKTCEINVSRGEFHEEV